MACIFIHMILRCRGWLWKVWLDTALGEISLSCTAGTCIPRCVCLPLSYHIISYHITTLCYLRSHLLILTADIFHMYVNNALLYTACVDDRYIDRYPPTLLFYNTDDKFYNVLSLAWLYPSIVTTYPSSFIHVSLLKNTSLTDVIHICYLSIYLFFQGLIFAETFGDMAYTTYVCMHVCVCA